jgi:hypothetical protein
MRERERIFNETDDIAREVGEFRRRVEDGSTFLTPSSFVSVDSPAMTATDQPQPRNDRRILPRQDQTPLDAT